MAFAFTQNDLNSSSYSKCDIVEEIVFLPGIGYSRPASQSPDITEPKFDDDDDDDDDDSWGDDNNLQEKFQVQKQPPSCKFLKTPEPSLAVVRPSFERSPTVFLRAPAASNDVNSVSSNLFQSNDEMHNVNAAETEATLNNDALNVSAQSSFDPFISTFLKNDIKVYKSMRDSKAARLLSAPVSSSTGAENIEKSSPPQQTTSSGRSPSSHHRRSEENPSFRLPVERKDLQAKKFHSLKPVGVSALQYSFGEPADFPPPRPDPSPSRVVPTNHAYQQFTYTYPSYVKEHEIKRPSSRSSMKPLSSDVSSSTSSTVSRSTIDEPTMRHYSDAHAKLMTPSKKMKFIDAHCHLDMVLTKFNFDADYLSFKKKYKSSWSPLYSSCITDFCCPATFSNNSHFFDEILANDDVYAAIGCHPLEVMSYDGDTEAIILSKAIHPKIVAIGELGLDYSKKNITKPERETQKVILERQLMLSVREINKPILLHCRDADDDCLAIMKRIVPHDFPIHWHSFTGGLAKVKKWEFFSNLYFGLTTAICDDSAVGGDFKEFCQQIRLDRLLLETDAPYFLPSHYKFREFGNLEYNHPGLGALVGLKLAEIRNMPEEQIFEHLYGNTFQIYTGLTSCKI